jgi:chemotaxis signal transduction protein
MVDAGLAADRVLVCRSDGERFALPVTLVREVVALPPLSRIPGSIPRVRGLANVHGTLVTVLGAPTLPDVPEEGPVNLLVVLSLEGGQVGFAVEEVEQISAPNGVRVVDVEAVVRRLLGES